MPNGRQGDDDWCRSQGGITWLSVATLSLNKGEAVRAAAEMRAWRPVQVGGVAGLGVVFQLQDCGWVVPLVLTSNAACGDVVVRTANSVSFETEKIDNDCRLTPYQIHIVS